MNDCPKAELRDRLPDLLHERLDAFARAAVVSHLEECALCREELELLRGLHGVMVGGVAVQIDIARIVRALPAPTASNRSAPARRARRFTDWRVAAAITMLLAAGTSVGTYLHVGDRVGNPVGAQAPTTLADSEGLRLAQAEPGELYVGGGLNDLSDSELQALSQDIENFDGLPEVDPEVSLPVPTGAPEGL